MKSFHNTPALAGISRGLSTGVYGLVRNALARVLSLPVSHWLQVMRERRDLAALDERMLRDIGVGDLERADEVGRPFWDARPRTRR